MALDTIPKQEGGKLKAIASGTLPSGQPVIVNADGTVSVAGLSTLTQGVGSATVYESASSTFNLGVYDPGNDKVIVGYSDGGNSGKATAVVGTVSGQSISFGTPVAIGTGNSAGALRAAFDVNAGSVIFTYEDNSNGGYGTAIVGQVSGTSFTFGSPTVFNSRSSSATAVAYDENAQKCVVVYRDQGASGRPGKAKVATISGTSVSFGGEANISSDNNNAGVEDITYDANAQKVVAIWTNYSSGSVGCAAVGTTSGTSISFGNQVTFESGSTTAQKIVYHASSQKVLIAYKDDGDSEKGKCVVGTVSGTNISFGSIVVFDDSSLELRGISLAYDVNASKTVISYIETGTSPNSGKNLPVTISGTTPSLGTATNFSTLNMQHVGSVYDPDQKKVVVVFADHGGTDTFHGTAKVFQNATSETNLTSENYIGMSGGVVDFVNQAVGSPQVFESANSRHISSTFDSTNNKVVIAYRDEANSGYGTAVVGTVSGNSISFGTPVVFYNTYEVSNTTVNFDSSNNKVVIVFYQTNNDYGLAVVGTVSGTSISFGSSVGFSGSNQVVYPSSTFDSSNNKIVIAYGDGSGNGGYALVGTVSGTSISFGSATAFNSGSTTFSSTSFDSSNNKVVISYSDGGNSNYGTAVVGTVSGTSISFGAETVFESAEAQQIGSTFDSSNNKVVVAYQDNGNSGYGTSVVGTVSGTGISFGAPVIFEAARSNNSSVTFDTSSNKVVIAYQDAGNSNYGTFISGTVSGDSISFGDATVFESANSDAFGTTFDNDSNKVVIAYRDRGNSDYGTGIVVQTSSTTRGQVASGGAATVDIVGTVSTNQSGLTAGQQYFVQTDGTLGLTAASPSVLAGTAISATKLIVKT